MNFSFISNSNFYPTHFLQKTFLEVSKQQIIIALIAFAALNCIARCLVSYLSRRKNTLDKKENFKLDKKESYDNSKILESLFFDQNVRYDILSKDLEDKVLQEQSKNDYEREVSNIKSLKMAFKEQKEDFGDVLQKQYQKFYNPTYNEKVLEVLYKALRIREIYKTTHYTFLHSRQLDWKIFSYLTKKLVKSFRPDLKVNLIEFLRAPFKEHSVQNIRDFIDKYEYSGTGIFDSDVIFRAQLISVDAFWLSQTPLESAMSFFLSKTNLTFGIENACKPVIASCLNQNNPKHKTLIDSSVKKIQSIICALQKEIEKQCSSIPGELVVICIPKTLVQDPMTNPCYRSRGFGIPFPHTKEAIQDIALLEELQQDEISPNREDIEISPDSTIQYRLIASLLTPKNGVRIFGVDALSKDLKKLYKQPIKELVEEIFAASKSP